MSKEKALNKIKKLLSLAQSDNASESELAAQRAAELMARHQISEAELGGFDPDRLVITEHVLEHSSLITHWKGRAALAAAVAFGGTVYNYRWRDLMTNKPQTRVIFVGRESDLPGVLYLYRYFSQEIQRLGDEGWEALPQKQRGMLSARRWKDSFRKGCASRVYQRIYERRERVHGDTVSEALVLVQEYEKSVKDYMNKKPDIKTIRSTHSDTQAFRQGMQAGENVNTSQGHKGLASPQKRLK